ncbi:MAG: indolepyruvate oxidoreductase subunit beta [Candidatus Spyradocola sp.]|jgi:indolepyruvate ferredoxin oxidoreductase beta subunit
MNCILAGVGGQGTVLASKLIAQAGLTAGQQVRTAETIGMAQRGGCVVSHVRTGDVVLSPLVPLGQADILIGFEPAEAVRCLPYLKAEGTAVVCTKAVRPVTASLTGSTYDGSEMLDYLRKNVRHLVLVDGEAICEKAGSARVLNVALLGAALPALGIAQADMENTLRANVRPQYIEMNLKALRLGAEAERQANTKGATNHD